MISGISDELAGACTLVMQPCANSSAKYAHTGKPSADTTASPTPTAPVPTAATNASMRRSYLSTSCPDNTNNATTGMTCTSPMPASTSVESVRS